MTAFTAVNRSGMLQPTVPLGLAEGEEIQLLLVPKTLRDASELSGLSPGQRAAAVMARIAAMKIETGPEETASRDHDRYIYASHGET